MNELAALQSLGITLPSPAYIFGAIVFGLAGLAAFRRGRKLERPRTLWLGVALMLYPYLVPNTWLVYVIGFALCAGVVFDRG
jgi:apolipoprotein N-acyltransferase